MISKMYARAVSCRKRAEPRSILGKLWRKPGESLA
jgi:hypothetical protein